MLYAEALTGQLPTYFPLPSTSASCGKGTRALAKELRGDACPERLESIAQHRTAS